jgi:hypothetical protein
MMFYLSLFAAVLVGVGCSLGESTLLGFMKTFPGNTVGYYASGTGCAGISGNLILIILTAGGMSRGTIYLATVPTAIVYLLAFLWLNKQKCLHPCIPTELDFENSAGTEMTTFTGGDKAINFSKVDLEDENLPEKVSSSSVLENDGVTDNVALSRTNLAIVFNKVGLLMSNLAFVYFLEYAITTSFTVVSA